MAPSYTLLHVIAIFSSLPTITLARKHDLPSKYRGVEKEQWFFAFPYPLNTEPVYLISDCNRASLEGAVEQWCLGGVGEDEVRMDNDDEVCRGGRGGGGKGDFSFVVDLLDARCKGEKESEIDRDFVNELCGTGLIYPYHKYCNSFYDLAVVQLFAKDFVSTSVTVEASPLSGVAGVEEFYFYKGMNSDAIANNVCMNNLPGINYGDGTDQWKGCIKTMITEFNKLSFATWGNSTY